MFRSGILFLVVLNTASSWLPPIHPSNGIKFGVPTVRTYIPSRLPYPCPYPCAASGSGLGSGLDDFNLDDDDHIETTEDLAKEIDAKVREAGDNFSTMRDRDALENALERQDRESRSEVRAVDAIDDIGSKIDKMISESGLVGASDELKEIKSMDDQAGRMGVGVDVGGWGPAVGAAVGGGGPTVYEANEYDGVILSRVDVSTDKTEEELRTFVGLWARELKGLTTPIIVEGGEGGSTRILFRPVEVMDGFKEDKDRERRRLKGDDAQSNSSDDDAPEKPKVAKKKKEGGIEVFVGSNMGKWEDEGENAVYSRRTFGAGGGGLFGGLFGGSGNDNDGKDGKKSGSIRVTCVRCEMDDGGRTVVKEMSEENICKSLERDVEKWAKGT